MLFCTKSSLFSSSTIKMTPTISLFFSFCLLLFFNTNALNITKILNQFPEFAAFNDYLTRTGVAFEIDSRSALTILAFNNTAASKLATIPTDSIGNVLRGHVILEYYNTRRLENIPGRSVSVTTLFQTTGSAVGGEGYLNVTILSSGIIAFGSAVQGAPLNANFVKPVILQPYIISIMQVSDVIIPSGILTSIPINSGTPSPMNSFPPSSVPGAAPGAVILPPSTTPMAARAPTPRKVLAPPPINVNSQPPSPFNTAPPSSESPGPMSPAHTPISIFDALPIPPSGGTTKSSACRIHWLRVTGMAIIVATIFVIL